MLEFGKRTPEKSVGRKISSSTSIFTPTDPVDFPNKALVDFIISHARGDERPYLEISIFGQPILGLLDSGASRTIVGKPGFDILKKLGLKLISQETRCTVANGQVSVSSGYVPTPVSLMDTTHLIDILVLPDLAHTLILGIDFWKIMNIVPDLRRDVWHFAKDSSVPELCSVMDSSCLSEAERVALDSLVAEKISLMGTTLGRCKVAEHVIELEPGTKPIKQRYYPVPPFKQKILDTEIEEMLRLGVIEPSKSPWSSPVCLVKKKDDSYRFCIDFRKLNFVTRKDSYPIPYISAILDRLRNARFISSIDIKSAFWQIPLSQSSRELTAFTVPGRNLYQFVRMPFGLTNAPATWQRVVDRVLGADLENNVMVYLDDIIIISRSFSEHLQILGCVFDRLKEAGLVVSVDKCHFCKPELKYLGYVVDSRGLKPDPEKVQAIVNIPPPQSITEIRRFIGTASWYRRFIPNFSSVLGPISGLTRKGIKWNWTPACQESFRIIKEALVTAPVLSCPDFDRTFTLQTDASSYGLGAVLTQQFEEGEKVISYLSRSLTKQEMKLTVTEKECLAVIWSVEKLRYYLEGVHFKVITDHHSLLWLHNLKDPQGRLARWALRLQPYDFQLIHRKGKDHIVPDFLSRSVPVSTEAVFTVSQEQLSFADNSDKWYRSMIHKLEEQPHKYPCWRVENQVLFKYVKSGNPGFVDDSYCWKLVVPKDHRKEVLFRCHNIPAAGHVGIFKTFWKVSERYYWPKMRCDVAKYVRVCSTCARTKVEQKAPAGLMGNRPDIKQPWQAISLDYIGPLPRSKRGNSYVLVVTDYFSKFVVLFPCRAATAKSLVKHIEEDIFLVYGAPQYLTCDNGPQMKSREFQALCEKYKTRIFYTAFYYPRADHTERVNRVIKTMLKAYVQQDNHRTWEDNLSAIGCAIRTSRHESIGYSPYFVNFGREYKLFGEDHIDGSLSVSTQTQALIYNRQEEFKKLYDKIRSRIEAAHSKNRHRYNLRRRPLNLLPGQQVWRKNKCQSDATKHFSAKLAPEFVGPFVIAKKTGTCTYELRNQQGKSQGIWHVQDLKPVCTDSSSGDPSD